MNNLDEDNGKTMRVMNNNRFRLCACFVLFCLLWPTSTRANAETNPPPLKKHTWLADPILIQYGTWGGDGAWPWQAQFPHDFVLYSDGRLITYGGGNYDTPMFYESHLGRRDICRLLYTIEHTGFMTLDFEKNETNDPTAPYRYGAASADERLKGLGDGGPSTTVKISAWSKVNAHFYMLHHLLRALDDNSDVDDATYINPAITQVVATLENYWPNQMQRFQPKAVSLSELGAYDLPSGFASQTWPLRQYPLAKLPSDGVYTIYRGPLADRLYRAALKNPYFYDRGEYRRVGIYPVFPQAKRLGAPDVANEPPLPKRRITCLPSDGLLNTNWLMWH